MQLRLAAFLVFAVLTSQAADLYGDRIVAKGKNLEVKYSEVEESFNSFRATKSAGGERVSKDPAEIKRIETEILDHIIATKLILNHATVADKTNAAVVAQKFIDDKRSKALSENAFNRQLLALGMDREKFEKEIRDQAVVKQVIDREVRAKQTVTDKEIEGFFKEHPDYFKEPERWKVQHIHLGFRDRLTLQELPRETLDAKKARMDELLKRARAGEDFPKLVKENSEDTLTRDERGEYTFTRGQMPAEFEAAATSLKPGQISDLVTTKYGWHIIKLLEVLPAKTLNLAESKEKIRDALLQQATQKSLPDYIKQLRTEANVEILTN
jgi:parvulin-like peptidyl-prolyl isomerase